MDGGTAACSWCPLLHLGCCYPDHGWHRAAGTATRGSSSCVVNDVTHCVLLWDCPQ